MYIRRVDPFMDKSQVSPQFPTASVKWSNMLPNFKSSINQRIIALCALSTGFGMMSSAFSFYYVKIFLNMYKIKESWFQTAQILFLIWNALNDPLFAYIQDSANWSITRTRRESVLYAAPLFALSFLVPWFPWGNPETMAPWVTGVHLITALCFWDTMFTYVGLAYCCIFTELSLDNADRLKATQWTTFASLIGSSSIFILQQTSSQLENFKAFQIVCVIIAIISCLLMRYCGQHAHTERELASQNTDDKDKFNEKKQDFSYFTITWQILFNRDFLSFVLMNFSQEFHRAFLHGFFTIIGDQLIIKGAVPDFMRSVFYGIGPLLSKSAVIFGAPVVGRLGYFNVIRYSYVLKIAMGLFFYTIGPVSHWMLMLFMLTDNAAIDAIFSLYNLPLSDIADSDTLRYNRRHPVTSMIYGTNALVVKPAQSLSPMLVVAILNRYGYEEFKEHKLDPVDVRTLNGVMYTMLCLFPLFLGVLQLIIWSFYTIRHNKNVDMSLLIPVDSDQVNPAK